MQAGAGKAELVFPEGFFPTEGFGKICSPLFARAAVFESENGRAAILSLELTSLPPDEVEALRGILREETEAQPEAIWVCVTHTFSAPHILPDFALHSEADRQNKARLRALVHTATRLAAQQAMQMLEPVVLRLGRDICDANRSRDFETPAGWWIGCRGAGFSDHTVTVLRADRPNGVPVLLAVQYGVQSSVLDGVQLPDGKPVSGDLAGEACRVLEAQQPGCTVLFLPGAAGDQAPREKAHTAALNAAGALTETDLGEAGLDISRTLGAELAGAAARAADAAREMPLQDFAAVCKTISLPAKSITADIHTLKPVRTYLYDPAGEKETTIWLLRIGILVLTGIQPEWNAVTARQLAAASPHPNTCAVTLVNGGAKYLPDADSYRNFTYEAMNSPFAPGSAEKLRDAILEQLRQMPGRL